MTRFTKTLGLLLPALALGFSLACDPVATPEGEAVITDMQRLEKMACGCDQGDLQCVVKVADELDRLSIVHATAMGTDSQMSRAEGIANNIARCMEKTTGPLGL